MSDKIKNRIFLIASLLILALSVTLSVIFYRAPLLRFWNSLVDLGKSAAYFFLFVFVPSYDVSTLSRPAASLPDVSGYVDYIGFNFTVEQITDFFVRFVLRTVIQIQLVVIEVLAGIHAQDFKIRLCREKLCQVADLLCDADAGQY